MLRQVMSQDENFMPDIASYIWERVCITGHAVDLYIQILVQVDCQVLNCTVV